MDCVSMYAYHLQVFHAVATYRSYSRAAREALHISQPAVSKHVQALEASLGVELFHRMGRQVALTEAGNIVLRYAEQMMALTDEMHQNLGELQGLARGTLHVGASATAGTYLLPPLLAAFSQRYPGIDLSMEVMNTEYVVSGMLARRWMLGFAGDMPVHPLFVSRSYCRDPLVLVVPPHHRLATQSTTSLDNLAGEMWVLREPGSASRQVVEHALTTRGVVWRERLHVPNNEALKQAVMAGLGIGMLSRLAVMLEITYGLLCEVPVIDLQVDRHISVVYRTDVTLSAAARAFLTLLDQPDAGVTPWTRETRRETADGG
jgi:DNA-binding transcriptional LysR family regulator